MELNHKHRFASLLNSLHLPIKNGDAYGPKLYKELVRECYIITKNTNTSYTDLMNITPTERHYLLQFIKEEFEAARKMREEQMEQLKLNGR